MTNIPKNLKKVELKVPIVTKKALSSEFVYNFALQELKKISLKPEIWKLEVKKHLIQQTVVAQQASWRSNKKQVKDRGQVSGGGKKPWKQKGTGRARHGSIRSPLWRGGGVTFGPTGRENYLKKTNRKVFKQTIAMLLSSFYQNQDLLFWNNEDFVKIKTKEMVSLLKDFDFWQKKVLFVVNHEYFNLVLSANNLMNVKIISVQNLNPYDLINSDKLLIHSEVVPLVEKWLQS